MMVMHCADTQTGSTFLMSEHEFLPETRAAR